MAGMSFCSFTSSRSGQKKKVEDLSEYATLPSLYFIFQYTCLIHPDFVKFV